MKNITMIGKRDFFLMSGERYPITMMLKSRTITGYNGETLFHVTAKHKKHGSFKVDCKLNEIEGENYASEDGAEISEKHI
ncbi:MAG: hypothetical protein U9Q90_02025 [Campylobacterota bacterium]|nr:hypothetical protein [Campylobacterota bacterium]